MTNNVAVFIVSILIHSEDQRKWVGRTRHIKLWYQTSAALWLFSIMRKIKGLNPKRKLGVQSRKCWELCLAYLSSISCVLAGLQLSWFRLATGWDLSWRKNEVCGNTYLFHLNLSLVHDINNARGLFLSSTSIFKDAAKILEVELMELFFMSSVDDSSFTAV